MQWMAPADPRLTAPVGRSVTRSGERDIMRELSSSVKGQQIN